MISPPVDDTVSDTPSPFPPEVYWLILGQLQGDTASMYSCALVCRAWGIVSQTLLFHSLRINCPTGARFHHFLHFLEEHPAARSHIPNSIRYLTLNGERGKESYEEFPPSPEAVLTIDVLRRILDCLPRLEDLSLELLLLSSGESSLRADGSPPPPHPPRIEPLDFTLLW